MQIDRERLAHVLAKALTGGGLSRPKSIDHTAIIKVLADIEAQGFVIVPREPAEAMIEAACRTHCDYFGGVEGLTRLTLPWRGYQIKTIMHHHFGPDPVEVFAIDVSEAL